MDRSRVYNLLHAALRSAMAQGKPSKAKSKGVKRGRTTPPADEPIKRSRHSARQAQVRRSPARLGSQESALPRPFAAAAASPSPPDPAALPLRWPPARGGAASTTAASQCRRCSTSFGACPLMPRRCRCRCHAAPRLADGAPRRFYNPNGDYDDADKEELVEECKASGEEVVRSAQPRVNVVSRRARTVLTQAAVRSQRIQERPIIAKFLYHARLKADEARAGPVAMYSR